jgi:hypothetical protein
MQFGDLGVGLDDPVSGEVISERLDARCADRDAMGPPYARAALLAR